jgi:hypothetical protein
MININFKSGAVLLLVVGLGVLPIKAEKANTNRQNILPQQQRVVLPTIKRIQDQKPIQDMQPRLGSKGRENFLNSSDSALLNRNQNLLNKGSEVAGKVQQILQNNPSGGIGQQVREVARAQNQLHTQVQTQLDKLNSKSKLAKLLLGTDYQAVKVLKTQIEQNQLKIKQLEELKNQLHDSEEIAVVDNVIANLTQENTFINEKITAEEKTKSLLGWFVKLFNR